MFYTITQATINYHNYVVSLHFVSYKPIIFRIAQWCLKFSPPPGEILGRPAKTKSPPANFIEANSAGRHTCFPPGSIFFWGGLFWTAGEQNGQAGSRDGLAVKGLA